MRRIVLALACLLVLFASPAMAGGGGIQGGGPCSGFAEGSGISMDDFCFDGRAHFAPAGTPLTVTNDGRAPHDYTAVDGSFATGFLEEGQSATIDGLDPGIYRVYCTLHGTRNGDGMAGVLVVGQPEPDPVGVGAVQPQPVSFDSQAAETPQRGDWSLGVAGGAVGLALAALAVSILGVRNLTRIAGS